MNKILVIEDELDIANIILDYLVKERFEVKICQDGSLAMDIFHVFNPDLVILDLMLPGMDGYEICRKIREVSNIPIIILSAKVEEFDKIMGLKLGADDYVTKPFRMRELLARVQAMLRRSQIFNKGLSNPISFKELKIYPSEHRVEKNGTVIDLSPREFDVLIYLASNPGQVFTRDQLYNQIWGLEALGDISTITVTVNRLRQKLESDLNHPEYIQTVWGVGYKFGK
ncbi:response regulator transcription factor [Anaerococcus sp. AGMB00486]|uniref:Response regulator transcription factor n=2 Tax=Anaerococcus TaxID=165779 RepID=A0ABX2N7Z3_9FIRM|nr:MULTISPECIES: response regulator transcription factor [Anaerococcus]MSS77129.1 response regulator transcription factor [Anaerococcus porci]NVF10768.1 response regulator transcription factor [Anaerococcus faecalis]